MQNNIKRQTKQKPLSNIFKKIVLCKDRILDYAMQDNEKHLPRKDLAKRNTALENIAKSLLSSYENKRPIVNGILTAISEYHDNKLLELYIKETKNERTGKTVLSEKRKLFKFINDFAGFIAEANKVKLFLDIYSKNSKKTASESSSGKQANQTVEENEDLADLCRRYAWDNILEFIELKNGIDQIKTNGNNKKDNVCTILTFAHH